MPAKILEINGLPFEATEKHFSGDYTEFEIHQLGHLVYRKIVSKEGRKGTLTCVEACSGKPYITWDDRATDSPSNWFSFTIVPESSESLSSGQRMLRCKTCGQVWLDFD